MDYNNKLKHFYINYISIIREKVIDGLLKVNFNKINRHLYFVISLLKKKKLAEKRVFNI